MEPRKELFSPSAPQDERQITLMNLLHTSTLIKKYREKIFDRQEINQQKFNILEILSNEFPGALSQTQIRDRLADKTIDLSRIVEQMDRLCLIIRLSYKHTSKASEIMITRKGIETLEEMVKYENEMSQPTAYLSAQEIEQLNTIMLKMTNAINTPTVIRDISPVSDDVITTMRIGSFRPHS